MTDDVKTLRLVDSLDMTAAAPLANELKGLRGGPLRLEADGVRRLGGQCLQVLIAARDAWAADGQAFEIGDPSPDFAEAAALFGCPELAAPQPPLD